MTDSENDSPLHGKRALVTGAAGGLGSALARALANRGVTVLACDVDDDGLQRLAESAPTLILPRHLNLTRPEDIVRAADEGENGEIDLLLHAAIRHFSGDDGRETRDFIQHTPEQTLETLAVSMVGPTLLTQIVARSMVRRKQGKIVFTGSMHRTGTAGLVMYAAAKAYLNALARGLFLELREHDILTSIVNPGGMHTQLHGHRFPWMLEPSVVAETIVAHLELPENVALLSFDIVPHDPARPDSF